LEDTGCRCLYYRQDILDAYNDGSPPTTWEELLTVGQDIVENEDMDAYMFQTATALSNLPYFWSAGGTLVNDEGAPVFDQNENRRALVAALNFIQDLVYTGVTPQRVASIEEVEALPRERRAGNLPMFISNNDQIERNLKTSIEQDDVIPDDRWQRWNAAKISRPADGGLAAADAEEPAVTLGFRPEAPTVADPTAEQAPSSEEGVPTFSGQVDVIEPVGERSFVYVTIESGPQVTIAIPGGTAIQGGTTVDIRLPRDSIHLFDGAVGLALHRPECAQDRPFTSLTSGRSDD